MNSNDFIVFSFTFFYLNIVFQTNMNIFGISTAQIYRKKKRIPKKKIKLIDIDPMIRSKYNGK